MALIRSSEKNGCRQCAHKTLQFDMNVQLCNSEVNMVMNGKESAFSLRLKCAIDTRRRETVMDVFIERTMDPQRK